MRCGEAWANALGTKSAEVRTASAAALPASNCRRLIPVTMLGLKFAEGRPLVDCSMQHLRIPALPSNYPLTCARCEDQAAAQEEGDVSNTLIELTKFARHHAGRKCHFETWCDP